MLILALNCGSSSIKSALIDTERRARVLDVRVDSIGAAAIEHVLAEVRKHRDERGHPSGVVHRIVHGGDRFVQPVQIDDDVLTAIDGLSDLAPLHNPPAVAAVRAARRVYPDLPHIAVFDTAFHSTLAQSAREYALPRDVRERFGIRRYGFHGISHAHVMSAVAAYLRRSPDALRIISCHLGNGASVTAIAHGRSVETSMGMTPLEGLVMGTRAGDLDAGILLRLLHSGAYDADALDRLLNQQSGLVGLTGTNDMREIEQRADADCRLAIACYTHRVVKYIGAYAAVMGGVDVIAFTGGVGENSAEIRRLCSERLEFLGVVFDAARNRAVELDGTTSCCEISAAGSRTRLLVVRADEELAMALDAAAILSASRPPAAPISSS